MKKIVALSLAGAMVVSMAAGTTIDAQATESGEKVVIKVTRWGEADVEEKIAEEFNATHDDIEMQVDALPSDGYGDRLTTSFSSGEGYDIFLSGEGDFYQWVSLGMTTDLTQFIEADTDWENPMSDDIMAMGQVEGAQQYLIKDYNPMCLWYNKDMFDAAGVEYPTDDWTWDDLYTAAQALTGETEDGQTFGFQAQSWAYAVGCYLESKGLSYVSEDYSTADGYLNSPEMAEALDTYFGWTEGDDRISPNSDDTNEYGDGTAMMINGKLAMFISGGWVKSSLESAGINYGTALVPGSHQCYYCASGYAISSQCKNPEAAWEVLKAITGETASEYRVELEAVFPTSQAQLDEVVAALPDEQKALFESLSYSVSPVGMRGAVGSAVNKVLDDVFEQIIYHEDETQNILDNAVSELDVQ